MMRRTRWLFAGGDASIALGAAIGVALVGLLFWATARSTGNGWNLMLLPPLLAVVFLAVWAATAKVRRDLIAVHEQNAELEALSERQDELFRARRSRADSTEEEFARIVEDEIAALPPWLTTAISEANVAIDVQDELPGQPRTLGLYRRSGGGMSEITLYRLPLLAASRGREGLRRAVHDTLLHELGHLFGMTERDLDEYTIGNNPRPGASPVHPPPPG
jgi:predicted Zn-dependent protease with MMP-like domain